MEDFNTKEIVAGELNAKFGSNVKMPEYSPINFIIEDIKRKKDITSSGFGEITTELPTRRYFGGSPLQDVKEKASLTTQVPITEAYDLVGGEWMKKFPTYKQGRDNAEFAAQTQSTTDKWINGTLKSIGKFNSAIIGGTAGIVYGVGAGIADQSWASVYDNDFSNWLNDLDQKMNYQLPNYYTKQDQDKGLFGQAMTANFWADKVLGVLSFTAGAIVSEGIWAWATGGTSLATAGARWGTKAMSLTKLGNAVGKFSSLLKKGGLPSKSLLGNVNKTAGILGGKIGEGVNTLRFTMTSAGYESSVEALQFRKEAEENFYANFEKLNGRAPEAEDIAQFKEDLDSSSNAVFATNMALVGSSNLLAFGKLFNIKSPIKTGMGSFLDKKLYGLGLDDATKVLTPSRLQKVNRTALPYLRSMVEEGLYGEGFQSITNKTANKWIEHTYNPSVQMENFDMAGAIYENMAEQYGTKEGWVENGVGMIIGILGEAGTKGRSADVKQKEELFKQEASFNQTYTQKALGEHMLMLGRMKSFSQEAEGHAKAGNITAEKIANDGAMHALFNNRYQIGRDLNETVSEMKSTLDTLTEEQFAEMGIEVSQIDQYKEEILNEFKTASKQFLQNRKYAEYVIGKNTVRDLAKLEGNQLEGLGVKVNNELLIQALTYNLSAGESANKVMSEITSTLSNEIGADYTASLKTMMSLMGQKGATVKKVNSIRKQIPALETERDALTKELVTLQNAPKETEGNREQGLRLGKVNERLIEVNNQIDSLNNQLTDLTKEINNNREFTQKTEGVDEALAGTGTSLLQDSITAEDLVKLEDNIKKLEGLIENYKTTNPQKAEYIESMLEEFKNANEIFQANQRTAIALSSGKVKVKHFNTYLGKKLQGKKTLDEFTSEWLTDLLSTYTKNKVSDMSKSLKQKQQAEDTIITEEEWTNFVDNAKVSEAVLNSLADKVANKEPLTERENAIFIDKTSEIEEILKQTVKDQTTEELTTTVPLNKTQLLRDKLDSILNNSFNNITGIIGVDGQIAVVKPTEAEIEEYRELLSQPTEGLFAENGARLEELKTKLGQWRLLDSAIQDDNVSIAELIEQLTQLEQQIEEETTSTEVTNEQLADLNVDEQKLLEAQGETVDVFEITQNTLGSATVRTSSILDQNGNPAFYEFSHLYPSTFLSNFQGDISLKYGDTEIPNATLEEVNNAPAGAVVSRGGFEIIKKDAKGTIQIRVTDFNANTQSLGMFVTDTGTVKWSYKDVYYFNGVDYVKVPSDYVENIEPQESYNLKKGDIVTLEVDANDEYTANLLKEYNKAKSDKKKKEAGDRLRNGLKIYVVTKDGIRVATMKGMNDRTENTEIFDIRNRAMQALLEGKTKVGISVEVSNIFMGSPSFTFNNGAVDNLEFTKEATDLVEATGYVQNGELTLNKDFTEEVNKTFVGQISKRNPNKKTPVVVVRKGAYLIAYPISVKKSKANKGNLIENLLNQNLTKPQLAITINNLIQENKIKTEKVIAEEITDQKIEDLIQAFNNKESFRTADEFADKAYKADNLQQDGLINIDLENLDKAISDPKVKLDFSTIKYVEDKELLEDSLVENTNKLNDIAVELYNDYYSNTQTKYTDSKGDIIEDVNYTNTFDDNPIVKTTEDIIRLRNINVLQQAFSDISPSIKNIIGKDKIDQVNKLLKQREKLLKSVKAQKSVLNSGKNNTNEDC